MDYDKKYGKTITGPNGAWHYPNSPYKIYCPDCEAEIGIRDDWATVSCPFCPRMVIETKKRMGKIRKYTSKW